MANEYVELSALKAALKITDTERDDLLTMALAAASRGIERTTGRRFWQDQTATARVISPSGRVVRDDDGEHLLIADIGADDDLVVEVGTAAAWTAVTDQVELEPTDALAEGRPITKLLRIGGRWPAGRGMRVRVTAKWGWPAVPDTVVQATLIQASRLYRRKDSPEGVLGSAEWGTVRLGRVDPDVYALIQQLILPGMA
jgi:hypothetical protein